uniref:Leukocyte cell-derived chemotaxin-2 n=2 Tax=Ascaris TaxID=6251 RepID=F1L558_ASCSU
MSLLISVALFCSLIQQGWGLGCMAAICEGNDLNSIIECDGDLCGYYKSQRADGELVEGVDVQCTPQSDVFAPFDGELYFWRPFGNRKEYGCADEGVRIEGIGQWQGYHVLIASISLDFYGGKVRKGEKIGTAKNRRCVDGVDGEPYLRLQLFRQGRAIDPTFHLQDCMCTGQICESNQKNELLGPPFKHDSRYNGVRGWDIKCPMVSDDGEEELRVPDIYSPIDAEFIGRTRLYAIQGTYTGCDNNGVVLVGTGAWKDFEVMLYNVHYREKIIGRQRVVQGEPIATRLDCENSPDSIFMEVRYRGIVVDISDMISAKSCKKPDFPPK